MRKQYDCVDAAKLIMSLFVIAIHTNLFSEALFPMLRLAVPVFFIFTGFFSFAKLNAASDYEKESVLWNIEKRYLQLYLFWFIVLLPFTIYVRKYYTYDLFEFAAVFLKDLIWGSTFQASWYLMACMLGIAIVYFVSKKTKNNQYILISLGFVFYFFATCTSKYQVMMIESEKWQVLYYNMKRFIGNPYNNFFISIIYISIGKMIAEQRFKFVKKRHSLLGFIICYLGLLCEFSFAKNQFWFIYNCDCWMMLAPTALFLALFFIELDLKIKYSAIMRKMSTIIYCSHLAIIMVVSKLLSICGIADEGRIIVFSFTLLCTFVLSLIIFRLEKKDKLKFLKYSH